LHIAVLIVWGIFGVYWLMPTLRTRTQAAKRQASPIFRLLHVGLMTAGYVILLSSPASFLSQRFLPDSIVLKVIGMVILLLGLSFTVWARVHLGQYWSESVQIKVDHELIRTGPYKVVRHPVYIGVLFGCLGTAIVMGEISAWLAIALILAAFLMKIWKEEKFLIDEFGQTYLQYKKEVKALIPFIV
jgi:protein-S-isoprenylcysteine O-methyltransferase Ste14